MPTKEKDKKILQNKITGVFIWDFKKGDNIIYNFEILKALFEAKKNYKNDGLLYNKPITIIIISIIECILDDFVNRVKGRSQDSLPNITRDVIDDFKYKKKGQSLEVKKLEKFTHYIDIVKKHNIFGENDNFYKSLSLLRDVRNKVHIQDSKENESKFFTERNLKLSEKALERIIKYMVEMYPRWGKNENALDIPYPWM
ncbi:MAG: hypothetical protein NTY12_05295 [Candidatus Falkowbacteria bacterium]|nr:hypothetical protein [Candidatus Falkowbacteria bacterium]